MLELLSERRQMLNVDLSKISDPVIRKAIRDIQESLNNIDLLNYKLFIVTIKTANTKFEIPHNLGYVPTDIIVTKASGTYTFLHSDFTKEKLYLSTTGPLEIRFLAGRGRGVEIGTN